MRIFYHIVQLPEDGLTKLTIPLVVCPGTNRHGERCARRHPFRTNELCLWKYSFRKVSAQVRKGLLPYKSWRNPSSIHVICIAACWAFATNKLPAFMFVIKDGDT